MRAVITETLTHGKRDGKSRDDVGSWPARGASGRVISGRCPRHFSADLLSPDDCRDAGFQHVQCGSIHMGQAKIQSIPALTANHPDAQLIHEAAIGRIAGDQILKLMTLGLTEEEAEEEILNGFLG